MQSAAKECRRAKQPGDGYERARKSIIRRRCNDITRCIRQRLLSGKPYRWEFSRDGKEIAVDVPGAFSLHNSGLMVEAAIQGLGIAYVPEAYAREALVDGRLQLLLPGWSPPFPGLCLYYASHRHVPPALKAFIAVLREAGHSS